MSAKYVCAFRGRRDSYQVPIALQEAGLLDQCITDAYAMPWVQMLCRRAPPSIRKKVEFRSDSRLPADRVRCLWGTTLYEHLRHQVGCRPELTLQRCDRLMSLAAGNQAAKTQSDLLLYSPYAWEAFTRRYSHLPRRVLFQYHPHAVMENRILEKDLRQFPLSGGAHSTGDSRELPDELVGRERDAWQHADLIFCASAFTRQSLLEAGCDASRCRIVPYGIDLAPVVDELSPDQGFHVVFVGSGVRRKGLHHLLLAWRQARLPSGSRLTLICRVIDQAIECLAATMPTVQLRRGVGSDDLSRIYATSTLFAMPSLVEGFGQVYLEALAQGCPVLGTLNTCLPDLGTNDGAVFVVPPGDVDALTTRLEDLSVTLPGNHQVREAARKMALRFPWEAFRRGIVSVLKK